MNPQRSAALAFALAVLFNYLFYGKAPGISLPVFVGAALLVLRPRHALTAAAAFAFSVLFALRGADELMFADFCLSLYLCALALAPWYWGKPLEDFDAADYVVSPPAVALDSLRWGEQELKGLYSGAGPTPWKRVFVGATFSVPLLIVFVGLMSGADMVFARLFERVWRFIVDYLSEGVARAALVLVVATLFMGLFAHLRGAQAPVGAPEALGSRPWGFVESAAALGLINALFLVFTAIQAIFLLGGEARIAALGVTYSEYARQGFWQMMAIALLAFLVSLALEEKTIRESERQRRFHKAGLCLMAAMTGVMMVSAFYRLWLYEQAYGFTVLRFYSHSFTLYLAAVFAILSRKVLLEQSRRVFLSRCFRATLALFLSWNLVNPHRLIASVNVRRHLQGERGLDVHYLASLSDDALPEAVAAVPALEPVLRSQLLARLAQRRTKILKRVENRAWPSYHRAAARALDALESLEAGPHAREWEEETLWKKNLLELSEADRRRLVPLALDRLAIQGREWEAVRMLRALGDFGLLEPAHASALVQYGLREQHVNHELMVALLSISPLPPEAAQVLRRAAAAGGHSQELRDKLFQALNELESRP